MLGRMDPDIRAHLANLSHRVTLGTGSPATESSPWVLRQADAVLRRRAAVQVHPHAQRGTEVLLVPEVRVAGLSRGRDLHVVNEDGSELELDALCRHERHRVGEVAIDTDLEVEVAAAHDAGSADVRHDGARFDQLAGGDLE